MQCASFLRYIRHTQMQSGGFASPEAKKNIHIQSTSSINVRHRLRLLLLLTWDSISQKTFLSLAPSTRISLPPPLLSHVCSVTSLAQTPTFPSDDGARGESVRRRSGRRRRKGGGVREEGGKKEESVPRLHGETDRQQGTAAALRLVLGFHCIAIRKTKPPKKKIYQSSPHPQSSSTSHQTSAEKWLTASSWCRKPGWPSRLRDTMTWPRR